jgi:hypothetical protein
MFTLGIVGMFTLGCLGMFTLGCFEGCLGMFTLGCFEGCLGMFTLGVVGLRYWRLIQSIIHKTRVGLMTRMCIRLYLYIFHILEQALYPE